MVYKRMVHIKYIHFRSTVESRYLEHSISRTLDVSNKFVGPLTVRDIER